MLRIIPSISTFRLKNFKRVPASGKWKRIEFNGTSTKLRISAARYQTEKNTNISTNKN